jgi:hypothetical protein
MKNFFRLVGLILVAFFWLTGCVRSDIGIRFQDANHGTLIQHIRIAEGSAGSGSSGSGSSGLESAIASVWLNNLEQQTEKLGGSVRRTTEQDATLTLPFFNAKDLEAKFNQLFQAEWQSSSAPSSAPSPQLQGIVSRLKLRSGNWIFWQRMVLDYQLDLRSLTPFAAESLSLDPRKLLQLEFYLSTPGTAKSLDAENSPMIRSQGHKLIWQLHPGELNHLSAVFWVPSPLGIGAVLIAILVGVGAIVRRLPPLPTEPTLEG